MDTGRRRTGTPNQFVLYVALPCMLFKLVRGSTSLLLGRQPFLPVYGIAGVVLYGAIVAAGRSRHMRWKSCRSSRSRRYFQYRVHGCAARGLDDR